MQIKIDLSKFKHLEKESWYNHNYYELNRFKLLQVFDEEYGTFDYFLIDGENKCFLGSAEDIDGETIEFLRQYT